jgi:O-acetyl-ADP-ribose deacetylase (regulator of RNase III)
LAPVLPGGAVVTPAGRLAARVVVHAISLERDRRATAAGIRGAVRSAMARVRELALTSVAFPALGSGIGGLSLEESARLMVATVREELASPSSIDQVVFALRGAAAYQAFADALAAAPSSTPAGSGASHGEAGPSTPSMRSGSPRTEGPA